MNRKLVRLGLGILSVFASTSAGFAQQASKIGPSAADLKKSIAIINRRGEEGEGAELIAQTAKQVATYLKSHELSAAEAKEMGLYLAVDSKDAAHFRVYSFRFHSGGTRGSVTVPVMQWKNQAGKLFAYAPAMEYGFGEIHKLNSPGRTMYLLLGNEQGSGRCMQYIAYVVELKGNYLLLDTPIFDKSADLNFCDVPMEFDARQQVLRFDVTEFDFDYYEPDDEPYRLLKRWGFISQTATKTLTLKFDGQHFIKP